MKTRLIAAAAACCTAAAFCGSISAEAAGSAALKENFVQQQETVLYDGGMLQRYVQELTMGQPDSYYAAAGDALSAVTSWYDPDVPAQQRGIQILKVMIRSGDSAMFCVRTQADAAAAKAVLQKYDTENVQNYRMSGETCFRLTHRSQAVLDAIRQELTAAGLLTCFSYNVPVYQQRTLTVPYLTGYAEKQTASPAARGTLTAAELQAYLDKQQLACTLYTEERKYGKEFFVVPAEKLTFQAHWDLAVQLYRGLGIVPDMTTDSASLQTPDPPECAGVPFDVDADMRFDANDITKTAGYLLGNGELPAPQAGDLNADGKISAVDLTLMKRVKLGQKSAAGKPLPDPPIKAVKPSLPSVGNVRIPVFAVTFPDCFQMDDEDGVLLKKRCGSGIDPDDPFYPHESITAFFDRASYGRLQLTGDVFQYTAEQPIGSYADDYARSLADEILAAMDAQLDYRDYDADKDGVLDSFVIALPDMAAYIDRNEDKRPDWWPFSVDAVSRDTYDGVRAGTFCVAPYEPRYAADFVCRTAHELCHAMGLPDYYRYATETASEQDGLEGEAGNELMDEGEGDLSVCSKLLLGWLAEDEVQVYTGGTQTFLLMPSPDTPSCIMIPKEPDAGLLSEYFLIEYLTPEGNNPEHSGSGIRVLHTDAEVSEGNFGPELTYGNHGLHYDSSHQKQRVLRLVNKNGYFLRSKKGQSGTDRIDGSTAGFHWYDADGDLTAETGLEIRVDALLTAPYYDPASPDTAKWISGAALITISETE